MKIPNSRVRNQGWIRLALATISAFCLLSSAFGQTVLTADGLAAYTTNAPTGGGGGGGTSDPAFVTGQSINAGLRSNFTGKVGLGFILTTTRTITWLGRWVVSGNSHTHTLRLYNSSGTELANVTVNCSGATTAAYLRGAITAQTCSPGQYYVLSDETNGGDQWYDTANITYTAGLTSAVDSYYNDGTFHNTHGDQSYGPVNFGSH